jgi:hypothetical protein
MKNHLTQNRKPTITAPPWPPSLPHVTTFQHHPSHEIMPNDTYTPPGHAANSPQCLCHNSCLHNNYNATMTAGTAVAPNKNKPMTNNLYNRRNKGSGIGGGGEGNGKGGGEGGGEVGCGGSYNGSSGNGSCGGSCGGVWRQ